MWEQGIRGLSCAAGPVSRGRGAGWGAACFVDVSLVLSRSRRQQSGDLRRRVEDARGAGARRPGVPRGCCKPRTRSGAALSPGACGPRQHRLVGPAPRAPGGRSPCRGHSVCRGDASSLPSLCLVSVVLQMTRLRGPCCTHSERSCVRAFPANVSPAGTCREDGQVPASPEALQCFLPHKCVSTRPSCA